ncbi:MAG: MBL fold metallo-hydrolase [Lachnospiraceae bacterium]|nr:MBL fold metallo-hydrolase [Lachnospiraceae bacterium]
MIVKVLVENTENGCFQGEHGLCLYVEYKGKKYLIDSGSSPMFAQNAELMGVDLSTVDAAFLSHAHYDHSSGYPAFFEKNNHAKVYLQSTSKNRHYFKIAGAIKKYIGIPKGLLDQFPDRFTYIDGAAKIEEGIYIVLHSSEGILERAKHTHMCVVVDGKTKYDDFSHEQTIVFEEEDGLVCFNSCSHSGVDIAIAEVKRAFPDKKIKAYFGGFHMMGITGVQSCSYKKNEVQAVAETLSAATDARFFSGHCTGIIAYDWLKEVMGNRLEAFQSGKVIEV